MLRLPCVRSGETKLRESVWEAIPNAGLPEWLRSACSGRCSSMRLTACMRLPSFFGASFVEGVWALRLLMVSFHLLEFKLSGYLGLGT